MAIGVVHSMLCKLLDVLTHRLEYATVAQDCVRVWAADTHAQQVVFGVGAAACCTCAAWHPGRPHLAVRFLHRAGLGTKAVSNSR
jgi:hypothetical protein